MDSTICDKVILDGICGGEVQPIKKDGRFYFHKKVFINVPKDFVIFKCSSCGVEYLSDESLIALNNLLDVEYARVDTCGWETINHSKLIEEALDRYKERTT